MALYPHETDEHDSVYDAAFLRRLVDANRDAIVANRAIRDSNGDIIDFEMTFANEAMQQFFVRDGLGWRGRRLREFLPATLDDGRYQILLDAIATGSPQVREVEATFRRGTTHRLLLSAMPRGDEVFVTLRDVTQERDTLEALAESERRYRELVEHQAELVCRFLPDTTILFANEAYARYHGSTPEALIGTKMLDLVHEDRRADALAVIAGLTVDAPMATDEGYLVGAEGTERWQQWTTSAVAIEGGTVVEVQAVGIDITDRKRAEIAVRARSEVLALVSRVSQRFIDLPPDEVDCGIEAALSDIGEALDVDRTYLVLYRPDGLHLDMTHEWRAPGVASFRSQLQGIADTAWPRLRTALRSGEMVLVASVADLDDSWAVEREICTNVGIKSCLIMPILDGGRLVGSVGFDLTREERNLSENEAAVLTSVAAAFGQVLARRAAELEVRRSERRYRALVAGMPDLLMRVGRDGIVLDWRPAPDATGRPLPKSAVGEPLHSVFPELVAPVERALLHDHEGATEIEAFDVGWGEGSASFEARVTVAGNEAIAVIRDVTEQQRLQSSLLHQATHDALTGLANRRLFSEHLQQALAHGRQSGSMPAVLFIDLDHFKVLNDSQGHDVGDTVLRTAARRLARSVRPGDVVARLGGDEFAVLCHRLASVDDAMVLAERVVSVTAEPISVGGDSVVITASIGVVLATVDSTTASVLRDADAAMYEAKAKGRRRVEVFTTEIREAALARHQVEHDLRRGLDTDELELYYQPLWSLVRQAWVGVEALVRWNHPRRGLLAPGQFLTVAEDAGLMPRLGAWVLDRACRDLGLWRDDPACGLRVWVNLSADQLMSHGLVDDVAAALSAYDIDPGALGVEVTETAVVGDIAQARATLGRLRTMGVAVALDDFGTGLSSLTHLDNLPLDVVKLDGAFVAGASMPGRQHDLVDGIVRLVRRLGLEVLAERVEGADEAIALQALGVDSLQGYFLGRPMPVAELPAFLAAPPPSASA